MLRLLKVRYQAWILKANHLRIPLQLYLAGAVVLGFGIAVAVVLGWFGVARSGLLAPGVVLLVLAFSLEAYNLVKALLETLIGKLVLSMIASMGVTSALMLASIAVNTATGQDPSLFPYTVALIAPLTALYFIYLISLALIAIWTVLGPIATMLLSMLPKELVPRPFVAGNFDQQILPLLVRFLAVMCLAGVIGTTWSKVDPPYGRGLARFAGFVAHHFDSYPKDRCSRTPKERVKRIDAEQAIVSFETKTGYRFVLRSCPTTAPAAASLAP